MSVDTASIAAWCERAEQQALQLGLSGPPVMSVMLKRKARGDKAQIAPGLFGQVVQWGDGTSVFPTVVLVECAVVRRWLVKHGSRP